MANANDCRYRVICPEVTYYFRTVADAAGFYSDYVAMGNEAIFQYFNKGKWNDVEEE